MEDSIPISAKQQERMERVILIINEYDGNLTIFDFRKTIVINFNEK